MGDRSERALLTWARRSTFIPAPRRESWAREHVRSGIMLAECVQGPRCATLARPNVCVRTGATLGRCVIASKASDKPHLRATYRLQHTAGAQRLPLSHLAPESTIMFKVAVVQQPPIVLDRAQ